MAQDSIYTLNIERAVLSSIIYDPEVMTDILYILKPSDFYLMAHSKIFEVMRQLYQKDLPIDEEFVAKKVDNKEVDESIMVEILSANPTPNVKAYAREIKDSALKRELLSLTTHIHDVAVENELPGIEALDSVQEELYKITADNSGSDFKDMSTITIETLEYIRKMKEQGNKILLGETTGFSELDKLTTGFNSGELIIIAARPAIGKTSLVLNTALRNIERDSGVVFFSLEMPSEQLMIRLLSAKTNIPLQDLRKGDLNDAQWSTMTKAMEELHAKKLFVDDGGSLNINQVRSKVRKLMSKKENNIKMVIIDYLQLMQGTGKKDRHIEVSEISRGLKMLAREMNIPVVALSQLNRGLEGRADKRPMLSDIRESGSIEQDADIILFVYRDDIYAEKEEKHKEKESKAKDGTYKSKFIKKEIEEAEIIIGKQRNGPTETVKLDFHRTMTKFADKDGQYGAVPVITTFQTVDIEQPTNIDIPDIGI